jgi:hypothetical protein
MYGTESIREIFPAPWKLEVWPPVENDSPKIFTIGFV